jgi:hypothetical protein
LATRDAVTFLVARKDAAALRVLVAELQLYLRAVANAPPYAELSELYRLASKELPAGPRAYAEKVGAEHAPLWLGSVAVDRPREVVDEPALPVPDLDGPVTLLCLPDGKGGCPRWFGPPAKKAKAADAR